MLTPEMETPQFWRQLKSGSSISLNDTLAIEDSLERGEGMRGRDYIVEMVRRIRHEDNFVEWIFYRLGDAEQELWLMVKIVDQLIKLVVYYGADEFEPADRKQIVERGDAWLFQEPDDPQNFNYNELDYAEEIVWVLHTEQGKEQEIVYEMKGQKVLYGLCSHHPFQQGLEGVMAAVVEYETDEDPQNPELLVLELGGEASDTGGLIAVMFGATITLSEVDVLPVQDEGSRPRTKTPLWQKLFNRERLL